MEEEHKFRKTRKAYLGFYLTCVLLIISYIYLNLNGYHIDVRITIAGVIFIIIGIKYTELSRLHNLYGYNTQYIYHKKGFFKTRMKSVFLARISDIIVTRGVINRMLNFGNVKVHHFGGSGVMEIKKINNPEKFIEGLQKMIYRLGSHGSNI